MTALPPRARVSRGALVALDPMNPLASIVVFQYNPAELTRTLQANVGGQGAGPANALTLAGPPTETIACTVVVDGADQTTTDTKLLTDLGIYPQLSAMELLVYPKSAQVIANAALTAVGAMQVVAPTMPLTLFVWGARRVAPVLMESLTIQEQIHAPNLNPMLARVDLRMRVLTWENFTLTEPGYAAYLSYQIVKERMAVLGSVSNTASLAGGFPVF